MILGEVYGEFISETNREYCWVIDDVAGVLKCVEISAITIDDIVLPFKSELSKFSKTVEAFFETYPEKKIEIYQPRLANRIDEAGLKWDFIEFEKKYIKEKMRQWIFELHPEYINILVPEEYLK